MKFANSSLFFFFKKKDKTRRIDQWNQCCQWWLFFLLLLLSANHLSNSHFLKMWTLLIDRSRWTCSGAPIYQPRPYMDNLRLDDICLIHQLMNEQGQRLTRNEIILDLYLTDIWWNKKKKKKNAGQNKKKKKKIITRLMTCWALFALVKCSDDEQSSRTKVDNVNSSSSIQRRHC